jgi:protein tyrosine/serine phosphatase
MLVAIAVPLTYVGFLLATGNIHEVEADTVYRSGQLWPSQLDRLLKQKNIRTVINLRGESPGVPWYDNEKAVADRNHVRHVSVRLKATREPDGQTVAALIEAMEAADYPVLIHCEAGADRTGLASALYRLVIKGDRAEDAGAQLSFRYGHFPWLTSRTGAMDRAFWQFARGRATTSISQ